MANDRIVFIPWDESEAGNFINESLENNTAGTHHKRKWTVICADSTDDLSKIGFGVGVRLHIAGHGQIGDPNIYPDARGAASLSYSDVADALIDKGLKTRYAGTIVTDVCYSALGAPPFAKLLAKELYGRGFKGICVMGYKGPLGAVYGSELTGSKYKHRVVDVEDEDGKVVDTVKSKHMQERFWGFNA
jgi:hypothetical protein